MRNSGIQIVDASGLLWTILSHVNHSLTISYDGNAYLRQNDQVNNIEIRSTVLAENNEAIKRKSTQAIGI